MKKIFYLLMLFLGATLVFASCTEQTNKPTENEKTEEVKTPGEEPYSPTDTILSFSDDNENKIITESTYDISQYTKNAKNCKFCDF